MTRPFASTKRALGICDRCGQTFKLKHLQKQIIKQRDSGLLVCGECLDADHPQLMLGMYPVDDPQGLRSPRTDAAERTEARDTQWGWAPVGGGNSLSGAPNYLVASGYVGTVTVSV